MDKERKIIKEMPTKETLEEFLNGFDGDVKVVFNREKGVFERVVPVDTQLGQPKTEWGWELRKK
jgi:hypothetical protein